MSNSRIDRNEFRVIEVLSSSDLNPKYLSCVKLFISSWLSIPNGGKVRFVPRVLLIANAIPQDLTDFSAYITLVEPSELHSAFVSQVSRIIEGRNSSANFVMTSDIDMLPMNIDFETSVVKCDTNTEERFYILRDVLEPGQYPICYNLARPSSWHLLLEDYGSDTPTSEILRSILDQYGGFSAYSGLHGGEGWTIDQQALWSLVKRNHPTLRIVLFNDAQTSHRRLDRAHHRGLIKWVILPLVFIGYYHDYHVHHPVDANKTYIRLLLKIRNFGIIMRNH